MFVEPPEAGFCPLDELFSLFPGQPGAYGNDPQDFTVDVMHEEGTADVQLIREPEVAFLDRNTRSN